MNHVRINPPLDTRPVHCVSLFPILALRVAPIHNLFKLDRAVRRTERPLEAIQELKRCIIQNVRRVLFHLQQIGLVETLADHRFVLGGCAELVAEARDGADHAGALGGAARVVALWL
jgi:hypothetical protein